MEHYDWIGRNPVLRRYRPKIPTRERAFLSPFVVLNQKGGFLAYANYLLGLRRLCDEAGVRRVTPHELRHSCTELYVQAGASAEDIRRLLNQSSLTATARYMHRTDERLSGIAERVGDVFNPEHGSAPRTIRPILKLVSP